MKSLHVMLLLAAFCAAGCRSNGNQELLERELRTQEDKIYNLEAKVEEANEELDKFRRENERLRERAGLPATDERTRSRALDLFGPRDDLDDRDTAGSRRRRTDDKVDAELPEVTLPEITLPETESATDLPRAGIKEVRPAPGGEAPPFEGLPEISPPDSSRPEGVLPGEEMDEGPSDTSGEAPRFKPIKEPMTESVIEPKAETKAGPKAESSPEALPEPKGRAAPIEETLPAPGAEPEVKAPGRLIKQRPVAKAAPRKRSTAAAETSRPATAVANGPAATAASAASRGTRSATASAKKTATAAKKRPAPRRPDDIESIEISKVLTTESGTLLIVSPRTTRGEIKQAAGTVSVVMLDPAQAGKAARVGRWDFPERQLELSYQQSDLGHGWYLDLPWPGRKPAADQLNLYVRYTTTDGENVDAQQQFTPE